MKENLGFSVQLNNELVAVAGIDKVKYGSVCCILNTVRREIDDYKGVELDIQGFDSETQNHIKWFKKSLNEENEIVIKVVKAPFDEPTIIKSKSESKEEILERKLKLYHKLKEELKDFI